MAKVENIIQILLFIKTGIHLAYTMRSFISVKELKGEVG
jgi:hypothetical protein